MEFVRNFPFFCIILSMFSGVVSSVLSGKNAKRLTFFSLTAILVMSFALLSHLMAAGESYTYMMGHFPAPWGNEIRAGVLEAFMAGFFSLIMILSLIGGLNHIREDVEETKVNLYFVLIDLLLSSLLALIYTNDLFTAYVFVEINTIAACGLIMIHTKGRTLLAAVRYMIFALLGSGLFLLGISTLYDLTGHLLMENMKESVAVLISKGEYGVPLLIVISFMSIGLAIKCALYPFHAWLPDAYGYSTASSSAILSSLVSKGYIFLLIKVFYRVIGFEIIAESKILNILFLFGVAGMIMGSISAMKENDIRRMIAFSSVAQIGYIFMGIGLGTEAGIIASLFHILSHAATKSLLFIAGVGLTDASGKKKDFASLRGAGYRNKVAGVAFTIGSLSMVGMPMFSGFISKFLFSTASLSAVPAKTLLTLISLAVSTILNAVYFLRLTIFLYTPVEGNHGAKMEWKTQKKFSLALGCFVAVNLVLGLFSQPIVNIIETGLKMFG
ncbi:MAG: proton-conducting transporter membrane subunit [Lachnospiraceae bacterium]|nr:proton-conducting transporter membrane subunit [Lachnospiraceae bacterium]